MRRFSGVGARLGLALLAVLAGALGLVYLIVVPSLQNRLVNSRLSQLERRVRRSRARVARRPFSVARLPRERGGECERTGRDLRLSRAADRAGGGRGLARDAVDRCRARPPCAAGGLDRTPRERRSDSPGQPVRGGRYSGAEHEHAAARLGAAPRGAVVGSLRPRAAADRRRARACLRARCGVHRRLALRAAAPSARDGGRADRGRSVRRADPGHGRRRGRPARAHVRPDARSPGGARPRPPRVHRERLARAAYAAVLARRVPGADDRRGAGRGDAA